MITKNHHHDSWRKENAERMRKVNMNSVGNQKDQEVRIKMRINSVIRGKVGSKMWSHKRADNLVTVSGW